MSTGQASLHMIASAVCAEFYPDTPYTEALARLRGVQRDRTLANARFIFCLLARDIPAPGQRKYRFHGQRTYKEIGEFLGDRDYSTIIHAVLMARDWINRPSTGLGKRYGACLEAMGINPKEMEQAA